MQNEVDPSKLVKELRNLRADSVIRRGDGGTVDDQLYLAELGVGGGTWRYEGGERVGNEI